MVMIDVAIGDPKLLRAMSGDPHFHSMELGDIVVWALAAWFQLSLEIRA